MENNDVHKKTKGRCLCGKVQFEIHGELKGIVNCHCSKCRKFHGNYGAYTTPIKHMDCKNQRIFGIGLANHLILLMPKFVIACHARKTWCGKYLHKSI